MINSAYFPTFYKAKTTTNITKPNIAAFFAWRASNTVSHSILAVWLFLIFEKTSGTERTPAKSARTRYTAAFEYPPHKRIYSIA